MSVTVCVKMLTGKILTFIFTEQHFKSTTVLQLKAKIREREGTPEDQQRLIFNHRQLEDQSLLSDCGVEHEDNIHLLLLREGDRGVTQIGVNTLTGQSWTFFFTEEEFKRTTVLQLKAKIRERRGIPENQQLLIFAVQQLKDDRLLSDYGVKSEVTLHLTLKLRGGWEKPRSGDGRMGDREGRNQSTEKLADFSKCTDS